MKPAELAGKGIRLVPYAPEHDARTVAWLGTPELRDTFGITSEITAESHRLWMESATNLLAWAIVLPEGTHCGNALLHCNVRHLSAYFQIYLGERSSRGRGVGREATAAVLGHAFTALGQHRVWLHTLIDNLAAERLYAGAGFVDEGLERESILRAGRFDSQRRWSILAGEWSARQRGAGR